MPQDRLLGVYGSAAFKVPCKAYSVTNLDLFGEQEVGGVACVEDDRVLVRSQTNAVQNGIYTVSKQSWQRAKDFNGPNDVVRGTLVLAWTLNGSAIYRVITPDIIIIGQSPINFDVLTVSGSAAPGCATAEAKDGQILISAPLTSKQMWTIRDVKGFMQTTGGLTIDAQLDTIPPDGVPAFLTVRGVGRNNLNNFAPQCDGTWPIIATSNPYIFTLGGSVWGSGMESSGGVAYVPGSLVDAAPVLLTIAQFMRAHGGGKVKMPPRAGYYLQSGSVPFVENTTFEFGDGFTQKADAIDQLPAGGVGHSIAPLDGAINLNTSKAVIRDLWVFDGRTHSIFGAGQHAFEGGSSNEPQNYIERLELIRVHVRNASGYGGSTNNVNGLKHFIKRHGSVGWCDGDTWDRKNTLNANYAATFEDEDHNWQALGSVGTNLDFCRNEANPFRSLATHTNAVRVTWRGHGFRTNDRIVITQVVQGNGITIPTTPVTVGAILNATQFMISVTGSSTAIANFGGNNVEIRKCVAVNGIFTDAGETYIKIVKSFDPSAHIGEKGTFAGATSPLNGMVTNGSYYLIKKDDTYNFYETATFTALATNPFTPTLAGSSIINCNFPGYDQTAVRARFLGMTGGSGCAVVGTNIGSYAFTVVDANNFTIDLAEHSSLVASSTTPFGGKKATVFLGPGASGTGSGGGSTITYVCPHISDGDRIIDSRGRSITLKTIRAMGEYYARTGVEQRGGLETSVTGEGGTDISVFDYRITSLDPPWIAVYGGGGNGITLSGLHAHIDHIAVRGPFNAGINVSATAYGAQIGSYTVQDAIIGADIAGSGTILGRGRIIDPVSVGVRIWGYLVTVTFDEVTNNPFTPVAVGSSIVTVFLPGYPKTAGRVRFAGQVNGSGCVIVGSNTASYLYTVVDDNHFTIDLSENITGAGSIATAPDAFGGADCNIFFGTLPHIATGVVIDGCQVEHNDPANAAIGIGLGGGGDVTISDEGRVSGCSVRNCGQFGFARAYMDKGNGSIWGPGNIGLPNAPIANSIVMPDGWQLIETVPLVGAITIDRGGLAAFRNLMIMVHHAAHNSGATQNMSVEFIKNGSTMLDQNGHYSRQGIATSTSKILFCGAVAAGVKCQSLMIVRNWNSSHPKHVAVRGGTDNVNTSLMNFDASVDDPDPLSGVRFVVGGGQWSDGTAYIYGSN